MIHDRADLTYKALQLGCWRLAETAEPVSGGHSRGCCLQGELLECNREEWRGVNAEFNSLRARGRECVWVWTIRGGDLVRN